MSVDAATYARLREIAGRVPRILGTGSVEIANGRVVLTHSPGRRHELAVLRIGKQLNEQLAATHPGFVAHPGADLEDVGLGRLRCPDLMVFPESVLEEDAAAVYPADVLLSVEVVSKSNPENDYDEKVRDYAAMGIPLYLLVDPRDGTGIASTRSPGTPTASASSSATPSPSAPGGSTPAGCSPTARR